MRQTRRLILLIIAITVHNFPEGLAVGVGYASVGAGRWGLLEWGGLVAGGWWVGAVGVGGGSCWSGAGNIVFLPKNQLNGQ
jgi:zinc transporter ZupT